MLWLIEMEDAPAEQKARAALGIAMSHLSKSDQKKASDALKTFDVLQSNEPELMKLRDKLWVLIESNENSEVNVSRSEP